MNVSHMSHCDFSALCLSNFINAFCFNTIKKFVLVCEVDVFANAYLRGNMCIFACDNVRVTGTHVHVCVRVMCCAYACAVSVCSSSCVRMDVLARAR